MTKSDKKVRSDGMELYSLNNETVDLLSEKIGALYKSLGSTNKEIYRAKLLLEEVLLKYQSHFGEEAKLSYRIYRVFGQIRFCVRVKTLSFDPFSVDENPMAFMMRSIMSDFENTMPTWKYHNLENEITFTVHRKAKIGSLTKILISVGAAFLLGIGTRLLFPQEALSVFADDYLEPFSDTYAGLFCVMAIVQTFTDIIMSIVHIGDLASVGAVGGRLMRRFFLIAFAIVIVMTLPLLPFFNISGFGQFNVAAKSIYDILIGFIPTNVVSPFLNFNSVHVMIIGAMFGFSLLAMGQKGGTLVSVFSESNIVTVLTNNFLNKFIAIYVGIKLFVVVSAGDFKQFSAAGKMVACIMVAELILIIGYSAYACFKTKFSLRKLIHVVAPTAVICLSSANFNATLSTVCESLTDADADADTVGLSINLGSVFFQPACTMALVFSALFMASSYGVTLSVTWLITAILFSAILVGAMPNIPGAAVSVITLLYAQLGIPSEGISLMIAVYALLQFVTVATDAWCLQCETLCVDRRLKHLREKAKRV